MNIYCQWGNCMMLVTITVYTTGWLVGWLKNSAENQRFCKLPGDPYADPTLRHSLRQMSHPCPAAGAEAAAGTQVQRRPSS